MNSLEITNTEVTEEEIIASETSSEIGVNSHWGYSALLRAIRTVRYDEEFMRIISWSVLGDLLDQINKHRWSFRYTDKAWSVAEGILDTYDYIKRNRKVWYNSFGKSWNSFWINASNYIVYGILNIMILAADILGSVIISTLIPGAGWIISKLCSYAWDLSLAE